MYAQFLALAHIPKEGYSARAFFGRPFPEKQFTFGH
jgi:hypothetical protein